MEQQDVFYNKADFIETVPTLTEVLLIENAVFTIL